jgi:hypothetical protein
MSRMNDDAKNQIRTLCTEIGSIMEDASVVALVWTDGDGLSIKARVQRLHDAHGEIGRLLDQANKLAD